MAKTKKTGRQTKSGRAAARGVGDLIRSMIDRDTDAILAAVAKKFPTSKCTPKEISWYRWKMKHAKAKKAPAKVKKAPAKVKKAPARAKKAPAKVKKAPAKKAPAKKAPAKKAPAKKAPARAKKAPAATVETTAAA